MSQKPLVQMPMKVEDLKARHEISKEQDAFIFQQAKDLIVLVAKNGIESVEIAGIKIKNGFLSRPKSDDVVISREHAEHLRDNGIVDLVDPLEQDAYADPDLNPPEEATN